MSYLITKSLLEAWQYTFDCAEGYEEDARDSFLKTLRREKEEPTDAMKNGIEFENLVYSIADRTFSPKWVPSGGVNPVTGEATGHLEYPKNYTGARKIADIIQGAQIQVKAQREITVDGMDFLVYGILDALKAGVIYDVKFLNKGIGSAELAGKYRECSQHPAYFWIVPEAREFRYLVSDGEDIYIERYERGDSPEIGTIISWFIASLRREGLLDTYREYWGAKE